MIISTEKSVTLLKRFKKLEGKIGTVSSENIMSQFALDPTLEDNPREVYIITNQDITSTRLKSKFEQAVAEKHPKAKILFIDKNRKPTYPDGLPGIDKILVNPKPDAVVAAITELVKQSVLENSINKQVGENKPIPKQEEEEEIVDETVEESSEYQEGTDVNGHPIDEMGNPDEESMTEMQEMADAQHQSLQEDLDSGRDMQFTMSEPEPMKPVDKESEIVKRLKEASSVHDISVLSKEITSAQIIKDLISSQPTYAGIEQRIKSLEEVIYSIMADPSIKSLEEKLSKVRALLHDKAIFNAQSDTIIEQRTLNIIDTICDQTRKLLNTRLEEIDTAIKRSSNARSIQNKPALLSGLNSERASIIIELRVLEKEITEIFKSCNSIAISSATTMAEKSKNPTNNDMINMHLKARGSMIVHEDAMAAIKATLEVTKDQLPDEFEKMKFDILKMVKLMDALFELDSEIIAAQEEEIRILTAHNVEESVIAQTVIKKSLRLFVGTEGSGRTIIPYLLSRYKSRQNANVLLLDLTGTAKYENYGINTMDIDTYVNQLNQMPFLAVTGTIDNTVIAAQNIVSTLLKSADYYRVINVVLRPDQIELFSTIAQDSCAVNFIVDANMSTIRAMSDFMSRVDLKNIGCRVVFNKCDISVAPMLKYMGLDDRMDYQICTIPTVPAIADSSINGYDPYDYSTVTFAMEDVLRHS